MNLVSQLIRTQITNPDPIASINLLSVFAMHVFPIPYVDAGLFYLIDYPFLSGLPFRLRSNQHINQWNKHRTADTPGHCNAAPRVQSLCENVDNPHYRRQK